MFGKLYMSTAVQYTAAAALGVVWLNRERDMFRVMYQFMFWGLCQLCPLGCARANCLMRRFTKISKFPSVHRYTF